MPLFHHSSAENRFLGLTAEDLKKMGVTDTTTRYNKRTAQNNATVQTGGKMGGSDANAANNQQAYANAKKQLGDAQNTYKNQDAGLNSGIKQAIQYNADGTSQLSQGPVQAVGNGVIEQSAIDRLGGDNKTGTVFTQDQIRERMTDPNRVDSIQQTMSNTGLDGTARKSMTQTTQQKIDAATAGIDNNYNKLRQEGAIVDGAGVEREKQTAIQSIIGQAQIQQTEEAQQKQAGEQQAASGAAANQATNDSKSVTQNSAPWLDAAIQGLPPDYQIIGQSLKAQLDAQATQKAAAGANLGIETAAADSSNKAYGELLSTMKADSDLFYKEAKGMAEDNQARREASLAAEKKATFERLAWEENKGTRDMKKALDKQVNTLVAGQAIGGGFGSSNWTKMVAEAEYEGETAILDFQKEIGFKRVDVDIAYTQTLDNIYATAGQQKFDALKAHRSEIQQINQFKFSATEKTEERKANAKKEYNNTLAGIAKEQASAIKEATNTVVTTLNQVRDDKRAQETLGWNILDDAVARYGSLIPKSTIDRVTAMLPAGTDIKDYINTPTIAERNSKRISGSGGKGAGTGGVPSSSDATATALYSNVTPQQLKEAVSRAFSPRNYGGTADERVSGENKYLARIASGESPATIMQSLATDYWSSQTGAGKTAHTERVTAQGSADSLESYIDFYGINGNDDGSLGWVDSKVEGFKSIFGQSSDEYNNLANNVGNIRARIIKDNYGAAVTPQELAIAKSYIPDMADKGAVFRTKLQNLKSYQAYLDAKVSADALGLPAPLPPKPVTLSGDKMSGPAKYTDSDINSALLE